ncbi:MAG: hypothetical protein RMI94_08060 [Bryobacterales bacterium]|nr:hypothetical protein [Bryobacteraceae bacterium]MDW8130489.1 hypothetical protein [Bryobacterales bacterium]
MTSRAEQRGGHRWADLDSLARLARRLVRRRWCNLALAQAAWTLAVALCAFILLLVAGAEVLGSAWLPAVVVSTAVWSAARLARNRPQPYLVLQEADRRLGLNDTLSSAYYFRWLGASCQQSDWARRKLFAQAEKLAAEVDPALAMPLCAPRRAWWLVCLTALAGSLFALRYGVTKRLDLHPPLVAVFLPPQVQQGQDQPPALRDPISENVRRMLRQAGLGSDPSQFSTRARSPSPHTDRGHSAEVVPVPPRPDLSRPVPTASAEEGAEADGHAGEAGDLPARPEGAQAANGSQSAQPWSEANSDLLEKFREALASLLSQLKPRANSGDATQVESPGGAKESGRPGRSPDKGVPGPGRQSQGEGDAQAEAAEQTGESERAQGAAGKSGGRDADSEAAREGRSGIGREDGRKDTREAEQLAAMGKLTELIGRRQANLTGEVTVEVASGSQKLRTPYSQRETKHADRGGTVHRDEVPLIFREYVQRYLELVRRGPPAAASEAGRQP